MVRISDTTHVEADFVVVVRKVHRDETMMGVPALETIVWFIAKLLNIGICLD